MTKISIITVCYNEPNLEKTCESIINQTMQDFEWVVIDGGSNEETQNIWNKYKHRINTFVSEPDNGIYDAYNKGVKLANGDYVLFLNSGDNFINNNVFEKISSHKFSADIVYGRILVKNKPSKNIKTITPLFFATSCIPIPATFFKKDLFEKFGFFSTDYKIVSDLERLIVFAKNNVSFENISEVITNFDLSGISQNKKYKTLHKQERKKILEKYFTKEELKDAFSSNKLKLNFIEKIFSIKNSFDCENKIITILGIPVKLKRNI